MGLFVYTQKGSIISMVDLPTTEIIEPEFFGSGSLFLVLGGTYQRGNFDSLVGKSDNGIVG